MKAKEGWGYVYCIKVDGRLHKIGTAQNPTEVPLLDGELVILSCMPRYKVAVEDVVAVFTLEEKRRGELFDLELRDILWMGSLLHRYFH